MTLNALKSELHNLSDPKKAEFFPRFFKTGKGQYGEGDLFIGVTVPNQRIVAKKYKELALSDIQKLLKSKIHEERLTALFILVDQYTKAKDKRKEEIFDFYLKNTKFVNNWDLVDSSASYIVGQHLLKVSKNQKLLTTLAKSENLWEKRIAIISTHAFIKAGILEPTFKISKILLEDKHDLIHKAVGWMLREAGNKKQKSLEDFLTKNYTKIPRTALRYAIEKFPQKKRISFLDGKI